MVSSIIINITLPRYQPMHVNIRPTSNNNTLVFIAILENYVVRLERGLNNNKWDECIIPVLFLSHELGLLQVCVLGLVKGV